MQVWYCTGTPQDAAGPEVRNWVLQYSSWRPLSHQAHQGENHEDEGRMTVTMTVVVKGCGCWQLKHRMLGSRNEDYIFPEDKV